MIPECCMCAAGHVEEFLKVTMCAPVVQGYGLTETCAGSFISVPDLSVSLSLHSRLLRRREACPCSISGRVSVWPLLLPGLIAAAQRQTVCQAWRHSVLSVWDA